MTRCRGVRGATTCTENTAGAILEATRELLQELVAANVVSTEEVAAAFFTATPDLDATFPAKAARELGFTDVPLMGGQEIAVPGAPERCIRILLLVNTERTQGEMRHVYLRGARVLRPEFAAER